MRRLITITGFMLTMGCAGDSPTGAGGDEDSSINIGDNFFNPGAARVAAGTDVTWTWTGTAPHNVTFDDLDPDSPTQTSGTFTQGFDSAGTFTYFCSVHGRSLMSGTVVVTDS